MRSRLRISVRTLMHNTAPTYIVTAGNMTRNGHSMELSIEGRANFNTVEPWCRLFHQTTEYLMIGTLTLPAMASTLAVRSPLPTSSNELRNAMYPK